VTGPGPSGRTAPRARGRGRLPVRAHCARAPAAGPGASLARTVTAPLAARGWSAQWQALRRARPSGHQAQSSPGTVTPRPARAPGRFTEAPLASAQDSDGP
jgi:hypothetical protein